MHSINAGPSFSATQSILTALGTSLPHEHTEYKGSLNAGVSHHTTGRRL